MYNEKLTMNNRGKFAFYMVKLCIRNFLIEKVIKLIIVK